MTENIASQSAIIPYLLFVAMVMGVVLIVNRISWKTKAIIDLCVCGHEWLEHQSITKDHDHSSFCLKDSCAFQCIKYEAM